MNEFENGPDAESGAGKGSRFGLLKILAGIAGLTFLAAAASNAAIALRTPPAQNGLSGAFGRYPYRHGAISYAVAGSGPPLLLLHGLGAGNSMNEWNANYEELKRNYTVYAFDFPGWGLSDKPERVFTAEDYIEPILFFAEDVIAKPCTLIASSDACTFAVAAAARRPELFSSLVLVCPATHDDDEATAKLAPYVQQLFQVPVLGRTAFNLFASRKAIRAFATGQLFYDKTKVTDSLVTRYYAGAHQAGSERGFAAFLSGALKLDVRRSWSELAQPALLVWGRNALINPIASAPEWLALKNDARLEVIDEAMLLPHTEHAGEFNALVHNWLHTELATDSGLFTFMTDPSKQDVKQPIEENASERLGLSAALVALSPLRDLTQAAALIAGTAARWSGAAEARCWVLAGNAPALASHWVYRSFPQAGADAEKKLPPSDTEVAIEKSEGKVIYTVPVPLESGDAGTGRAAVLQLQLEGEAALTPPPAEEFDLLTAQLTAVLSNARVFESLRRTGRGWERTFDGMIDGVAILHADGRIVRANKSLVSLLDLPSSDIVGRRRDEVLPSLPGYQLVRSLEAVAHTVAGLPAQQGEFCFGTPAKTILQTVFPLHETGRPDNVSGSVCVLREMTETPRLQEQSSQSEKLAALGELVSGFAHELNNPLTAVIGYAQLLESDTSLPPSLHRPLQTIHSEATRASRIVGNLLAFARREEPTKVGLNMNEVVRAVVEMRAYQLRAQNTEILAHYADDLPQIYGDSHQLQQVLLNIINNAHQAMQAWRGGGQITISTGQIDERNVRVVVADNGPGIAADHLRRIFDPFWTTKPLGQGTGLGMSISLRAVVDHGGRLWAESQLGKGAQFFMELPAAEGLASTGVPVRKPSRDMAHTEEPADGEGSQILVIDDEEPVVTLITEVLRLDGHVVTPAFNGAEALALLQTRSFDLILSDVRMPAVGGPTFFEILQTTHPQLLPRVIFVTGDTVSPSTQEFLRRAARPILSKPFAPDRLRDIVNEHLPEPDA